MVKPPPPDVPDVLKNTAHHHWLIAPNAQINPFFSSLLVMPRLPLFDRRFSLNYIHKIIALHGQAAGAQSGSLTISSLFHTDIR